VNLLRSWNINPACVVGHSSGEIAAAYACRAITAKEAILVAYYRGQVTKKVTVDGGMAAIGLGCDDVSPLLVPGVTIACMNSHKSATISGDADKLEAVVAAVKKSHPDVLARILRVEKAYHSGQY
jgi:acyl transferase domain-containing protein